MIDDNPFDRLNNNAVAHPVESRREDFLQGGVEIIWIEEWAVVRKSGFALSKCFNDGVIRPENPPGEGTGVF